MKALKSDSEYTLDVIAMADEIARIAVNQGKAIVIAAYPETPDEYPFADCRFGLNNYHKRGVKGEWYKI